MEKKVHIMLFSPEGQLVEEKLIGQDSEFYKGPQLIHEGPFRLGITFMEKEDVDKAIRYIQQLYGSLPLNNKEKKLKKAEPDTPAHREGMVQEALNNAADQDQFIKWLRGEGFVFITSEYLLTLEGYIPESIPQASLDKYQWMVKRLKQAKNPKADKYDLMLLFGITLMGERHEKVVIYLNGESYKRANIPLPTKPRETHKKTEMMKFPAAMIPEERDKFRFELRQLQLDPQKEITKFFARWRPFIDNVPAIEQDNTPTVE